ncbi:MAG: hypothetical protein DDG59_13115 [Anaerolineae bacterium]|jgi:hypothetical protein|nr:MAG: hypothetical protein DDG59_13115 [Anaerolineae bacterium]
MNRRLTASVLILGLCAWLLVETAFGMSSTNYRLEWFTPLSGSGGSMSSAHYRVDFTVGQSASVNLIESTQRMCLGYWCGGIDWRIFLPLILRN